VIAHPRRHDRRDGLEREGKNQSDSSGQPDHRADSTLAVGGSVLGRRLGVGIATARFGSGQVRNRRAVAMRVGALGIQSYGRLRRLVAAN
jgi:hypothetical protein